MESPAPRDRSVEIPLIDRSQLQRRLGDPSYAIVNVLPYEAFRAGRVPGSLSLPVADIPTRARELLPDLTRPIIVYCGSDT